MGLFTILVLIGQTVMDVHGTDAYPAGPCCIAVVTVKLEADLLGRVVPPARSSGASGMRGDGEGGPGGQRTRAKSKIFNMYRVGYGSSMT